MTSTRRQPDRHAVRRRPVKGKGHCLEILRQLSSYLDQELSGNVCDEIRRHLGSCPNCELFVSSLRQTVSLCQSAASPTMGSTDKRDLKTKILAAATRTR